MLGYSVIIPQRDCGDQLRRQLTPLCEVLAQLGRPFEIIVVDDGSSPATQRLLEKLLGEFQTLRLLRLDAPCGASVALSAGMASARGEVVVAIEPGDRYPVGQIPALVHWLNRADLIVGRRRRTGIAKAVASHQPHSALAAAGVGIARSGLLVLGGAARSGGGHQSDGGHGAVFAVAGGAARLPRVRNVRGRSRRPAVACRMCGPMSATCWRRGGCAGGGARTTLTNCLPTVRRGGFCAWLATTIRQTDSIPATNAKRCSRGRRHIRCLPTSLPRAHDDFLFRRRAQRRSARRESDSAIAALAARR